MKINHVRTAAVAVALAIAGSSGVALAQDVATTTTETSRDEGFDDWGLLGLLGLAGLLGRRKAERNDVHIDHTRSAGR